MGDASSPRTSRLQRGRGKHVDYFGNHGLADDQLNVSSFGALKECPTLVAFRHVVTAEQPDEDIRSDEDTDQSTGKSAAYFLTRSS